MVISSVEPCPENVVYRLWYDTDKSEYHHEEIQTYGLDANLILEEKMLVGSRYETVQKLVDQAAAYLSNHQLEEADTVIAQLEGMTDPTQPTLVRLRSVWNRLRSRAYEIHRKES